MSPSRGWLFLCLVARASAICSRAPDAGQETCLRGRTFGSTPSGRRTCRPDPWASQTWNQRFGKRPSNFGCRLAGDSSCGSPVHRGSIACWLVFATVSCKALRARGSRCKRKATPSRDMGATRYLGATRLLVDADSHSIEQIEDVITQLEKSGRKVHTTVFAPPGRDDNKRWSQFLQDPRITLQPVERNSSRVGEANDAEIDKALRNSNAEQSVALLISDFDHADAIMKAMSDGKQVSVFVTSNLPTLIDRYRRVGVDVTELQPRVSAFARVRAILHQDGSGDVQLDDPCPPWYDAEIAHACEGFLHKLGYLSNPEREKWIHAVAKFWLNNGLGSITVFPAHVCIPQVLKQMQGGGGKTWKKYGGNMAFFLPKSAAQKPTKTQLSKFGNRASRQVFKGGGPFLLNDSTTLVSQALRKLGYVDDTMNADVREAMLVFVNAPKNKSNLRKNLDALPAATDTAAEVEEKLRHAFLSHLTDGQWEVARKDDAVRKHLYKQGLLDSVKAAREDVFVAMAEYARQHQLPEMKTYNGYVFRVVYSLDSNPTKTGAIEILQ
ncbi:unnamed protein product [Symbiodinium sp. CCMP2592]|nr:unnamed protein product [Symbiodinium sp. CCMP2592]